MVEHLFATQSVAGSIPVENQNTLFKFLSQKHIQVVRSSVTSYALKARICIGSSPIFSTKG